MRQFDIRNRLILLLLGITFFPPVFFVASCTGEHSKPYDRALVTTYAELTLLYEKEKMMSKLSDSLYQIKVKEFFVAKGYEQKKFKKVVEELSQHPEIWKMFIQDVSIAMDSLRTLDSTN